jgi:predicted permease
MFAIIALGWFARARGFLPETFMGPANRLVYYWAIPAMIFRSIYQGSFKTQFNPGVLLISMGCILAVFILAIILGFVAQIEKKQMGSFIQSSFHGNLGYIGLAVSYYYLGDDGFVKAGILAGFIMILQNFLAVVILYKYSSEDSLNGNIRSVFWGIIANPVILAAMAGILVSLTELAIPLILDRSLDILSGMALPMALLLIGASLSFRMINQRIFPVFLSSGLKLMLLPGSALLLYRTLGQSVDHYLPALILLASPTATLVYVMAQETKNDTKLAVAVISTTTLISVFTFSFWIMLAA